MGRDEKRNRFMMGKMIAELPEMAQAQSALDIKNVMSVVWIQCRRSHPYICGCAKRDSLLDPKRSPRNTRSFGRGRWFFEHYHDHFPF
jgi:hypothetical protein